MNACVCVCGRRGSSREGKRERERKKLLMLQNDDGLLQGKGSRGGPPHMSGVYFAGPSLALFLLCHYRLPPVQAIVPRKQTHQDTQSFLFHSLYIGSYTHTVLYEREASSSCDFCSMSFLSLLPPPHQKALTSSQYHHHHHQSLSSSYGSSSSPNRLLTTLRLSWSCVCVYELQPGLIFGPFF